MINFNDIPKQAKHFAVIYYFDGKIHDLAYRYYNENQLPICWGQVIELIESEDPECPFDENRFDNHTKEILREIAEVQLEQIKQNGENYNIPENAIGCLKVYMKLESDGEIEETEGIHIVFFDEDWNPMNDDIYVLYNILTNELFENPFEDAEDYSFDCEEFEIRYGL